MRRAGAVLTPRLKSEKRRQSKRNVSAEMRLHPTLPRANASVILSRSAMGRIAFADESGLDPKTHCYAIGVLSFDESRLEGFEREFSRGKIHHGVSHELKWQKVGNGHGVINLALAWLDLILRSRTASFDIIVVNTQQFRNWGGRGADREAAFYQTYTFLLKHIGLRSPITKVLIDDRSTRYPKHHEVVKTIANHMLSRLSDQGRLSDVSKVTSSEVPGVQVADLLTGAIAASHRLYLDPTMPINAGKRLAIERLAALLGWDDLCYDTRPNTKFNIWHFPTEYRAYPKTRRVRAGSSPRYVDAGTLTGVRSAVPRAQPEIWVPRGPLIR
jgi:Protein of unknown function (DUF3800)